MDFYERVKKEVKKGSGTSLQEFIIGLGINHDTYYAQKRVGNLPRADEALRIAKALGTSIEYLITGEESNFASSYRNALKSIQEITNKTLSVK